MSEAWVDIQPNNPGATVYLRAARAAAIHTRTGGGNASAGAHTARFLTAAQARAAHVDDLNWPKIAFDPQEWGTEAACAGREDLADAFHPPASGGRPPAEVWRLAREFCGRCPVIRECAAEATQELFTGLWGGGFRTGKNGVRHYYRVQPLVAGAPDLTGEAA